MADDGALFFLIFDQAAHEKKAEKKTKMPVELLRALSDSSGLDMIDIVILFRYEASH